MVTVETLQTATLTSVISVPPAENQREPGSQQPSAAEEKQPEQEEPGSGSDGPAGS